MSPHPLSPTSQVVLTHVGEAGVFLPVPKWATRNLEREALDKGL